MTPDRYWRLNPSTKTRTRVQVEDDVVLQRLLLDVEAVLESAAAARHDGDPEPGGLGRHVLRGDELPDFGRGLVGEDELELRGLGVRGHVGAPWVTLES